MDTVFIKGLKINAPIGFYRWEPLIQRTLLIDVFLELKPKQARASLSETVDYEFASNSIRAYIENTEVKLLEELAEGLIHLLFTLFDVVQKVSLTITKPGAVKGVGEVGYSTMQERL